MTITTQDALTMLKSGDYIIAPQVSGLPSGSSRELQACLVSALEDYERVMKDAKRYQHVRMRARLRWGELGEQTTDMGTDAIVDAQIAKEKS